MNRDEPRWTKMNLNAITEHGKNEMRVKRSGMKEMDGNELKCTWMNWHELEWTSMNQNDVQSNGKNAMLWDTMKYNAMK
jgi:hypothetical protein